MEELNIPIYRGKIKNIKEAYGELSNKEYVKGYVEGYYFNYLEKHYIRTKASSPYAVEIDHTTLSISFKDMLDTTNNRIFASLSNLGKGGDCTFMENGYNETFCWDSLNGCIVLKSPHYEVRLFRDRRNTHFKRYEIIGIQE